MDSTGKSNGAGVVDGAVHPFESREDHIVIGGQQAVDSGNSAGRRESGKSLIATGAGGNDSLNSPCGKFGRSIPETVLKELLPAEVM